MIETMLRSADQLVSKQADVYLCTGLSKCQPTCKGAHRMICTISRPQSIETVFVFPTYLLGQFVSVVASAASHIRNGSTNR